METMITKLDTFRKDFEGHVLTTLHESDDLKVYHFANPDKFSLWQRWIFTGSKLIVTGDCYDSIYSNGPFQCIESAASCNLSYFSGKCSADRDGYSQSSFDGEVATESIHEMICQNFEHLSLFEESDPTEDKLEAIVKHLEDRDDVWQSEIPRHFEDEFDTVIWLRENTHIVGEDWWDGISLHAVNNHPYWHLAAIKEAAKQLASKTAAEPVAQ